MNNQLSATVERWAQFESHNYEVSNLGNCRNRKTGKLLKPEIKQNRNLTYCLSINGKPSFFVAKYIIFQSFYGKVPAGSYLRMKNGNKYDIALDNIELYTPVHVSYDRVVYVYLHGIDCADKTGNTVHYVFAKPVRMGSDGTVNGIFLNTNKNSEYALKQIRLADGTDKLFKVHRLMAAAFLSDYSASKVVNHIDHDHHNNNISNLECVNQEDNSIHAFNAPKRTRENLTYELRDENNEIYGMYKTFKDTAKAMELYLTGGAALTITSYPA